LAQVFGLELLICATQLCTLTRQLAMTGVIEVVAIGAAVSGVAGYFQGKKNDQLTLEEKEADQLYQRYFKEVLRDVGGAEVTYRARMITESVDPLAANCIRIIEQFQSERRKSWGLWKRPADFSGDIRTLVLEEVKDWLLKVSRDTLMPAAEVSNRLEYCRQLMLRPSIFKADNDFTFLQTIAHVCKELDKLHRRMLTQTKINADKLDLAFRTGKELLETSVSIFHYALSNDVTQRAKAVSRWGTPPPELDFDVVLLSANKEDEGECKEVDWSTDAGKALCGTLSTRYFKALYLEGAQREEDEAVYADSFKIDKGEDSLHKMLEQLRSEWTSGRHLTEGCGLLEAFRGKDQANTRSAYVDLLIQTDRLAYFLHKMRPYKELGWQAGDIAMCRLHKQLSHLLQEIESDLVLFRQAWLEVMRGAKRQMCSVTKRRADRVETYWIQGIRHIDTTRAGDLYNKFLDLCNEIRVASSEARAFELEHNAMKGIENITATFNLPEYESRLTGPALAPAVINNMQALKFGNESNPKAIQDAN